MRNRDNNTGGIFFDFLKIFAFAFLLLLLKYVAIALGTIGLIVGLIYIIKEYFRGWIACCQCDVDKKAEAIWEKLKK